MRGALWLWLVSAALAAPAWGAAPVIDPGCGTFSVAQREHAVVYALPRTFLRAGTDSVWSRGRTLRRDQEYVLDLARGSLRLLTTPVPGETLQVRVCWLLDPPPLEFQIQAYRPTVPPGVPASDSLAEGPPVSRPATARVPSQAPPGASLAFTGNKTLAVDFGSSQDAFLRQSLDLGLSGSLAPGVELTGVLSDRNTPLSAAGATQDLQSVDRLLVELRAPQGGAALGDVPLSIQRGEFARLERRLQGARADWTGARLTGVAAAASAQGEFRSLQFFGIEGLQGPYQLVDRDGNTGISVVAGSEVVTVDGERLIRGESADYAMDYERARITFTNRRPVSSASRITVDYQFTVQRFRRNLAAASADFTSGPWRGFTTFLHESDDRQRPLALTFDASDRLVLAAAGDSAGHALGSGVTPGGGDYDLVVRDSTTSYYAFAGPDSGDFAIAFVRAGLGQGDYADSALVQGRTSFRYVGPGNGGYRVGRALPLPDAHQLWSVAGGMTQGPLAVEIEGALSRLDLNTLSTLDDGDNLGRAGHARVALEGKVPRWLGGSAGLSMRARHVGQAFQSFGRLEQPFAQEDWGLPLGQSLERQSRWEGQAFWRPGAGGALSAFVGRLETPSGFHSLRRGMEWSRGGRVASRARWERADGRQEGMAFPDGGRERIGGELSAALPWLEPRLRGEWDERTAPGDSARFGARSRELAGELRAPVGWWPALVGYGIRREGTLLGAGFSDRSEARTARASFESPAGRPLGAALLLQRRDLIPLGDPAAPGAAARTRSDLASVRLQAIERRGLAGSANLEITSEGESERTRVLRFVGSGQGAYDSLGNFVGTGDYDLILTLAPGLARVARAATSARGSYRFGAAQPWRDSRVELSFESDARRRGTLIWTDAMLSPGAARDDAALSRGVVAQRLEADLLPGSALAALRLRLERRASGDRSFSNFSQALDERSATARWRTRPSAAWSTEVESRWKRQEASQALSGGGRFRRALGEAAGAGQLVWSPDARWRAVMAAEATWTRPVAASGQPVPEATRTIRLGPDLGLSVGAHGRLDLTARRAFVAGPPATALLPSADPAGAPRWEATTRFDYRLRESTTLGLHVAYRERPGRPAEHTGRAEVRAFF